jgi:hypothetical protein
MPSAGVDPGRGCGRAVQVSSVWPQVEPDPSKIAAPCDNMWRAWTPKNLNLLDKKLPVPGIDPNGHR